MPTEFGERSILRLINDNVPLVLIDRYYSDIQTNNVLIDNFDASYQATQYLIQKGCEHIALFIYDTCQPHMAGRRNGYMKALNEKRMNATIKEISYKMIREDINEGLRSLLENENRIDGILFATNTIAVNGLKQLFRFNVNIPGDIQVVCFDKSDIFEFLPAPVPYILQPIQSMAKMASRLLLEQLEQTASTTSSYCLMAELITG